MTDLRPYWQAINDAGDVVGGWHQNQHYTPEKIREYRDWWHPGTRLRVVQHHRTERWDDKPEQVAHLEVTRNEEGAVDIRAVNRDGQICAFATYKDAVGYLPALQDMIDRVL
jgi:hypothetical protein